LWRAEDPPPADQQTPTTLFVSITDRYFATMGIPLIAGRECGPQDTPQTALSVVVNQLLAERLWPGESPIGRQVRAAGVPGPAVVVGVAGVTRHRSFDQAPTAQVYGCFAQNPGIFATVAARTSGEPMALARSVQQAVWSVDPDQPTWKIRTMDSMMTSSANRERFMAVLMSAAALMALGLAALGVYGVMSYTVARRAREVGVRMALGASRGSILGMVLRESVVTVGLGLTLGLVGAVAAARVLATQLYEIAPRDPATLVLTAVVLGVTAIAASLMPAVRAAAVDPVVTLRR
jgi:putative ABC transport system permease protein